MLSKERAEGERRGAERAVEYVESQIPEVHGEAVHKQELKEILKEARNLPADSTEECCYKCYVPENSCDNFNCPCHSTTPDSTEKV